MADSLSAEKVERIALFMMVFQGTCMQTDLIPLLTQKWQVVRNNSSALARAELEASDPDQRPVFAFGRCAGRTNRGHW